MEHSWEIFVKKNPELGRIGHRSGYYPTITTTDLRIQRINEADKMSVEIRSILSSVVVMAETMTNANWGFELNIPISG